MNVKKLPLNINHNTRCQPKIEVKRENFMMFCMYDFFIKLLLSYAPKLMYKHIVESSFELFNTNDKRVLNSMQFSHYK